jgi:nucleotidyltransferase/DNA polymerase involved in DNA repair
MTLEYSPHDEFYVDLTSQTKFRLRNLLFSPTYLFAIADHFSTSVETIGLMFATFVLAAFYTTQWTENSENSFKLVLLLNIAFLFHRAYLLVQRFPLYIRIAYGKRIMKSMCQEVKGKTKMTASAGVSTSTNKFRAKLASSGNKPNRVFAILPWDFEDFLMNLKIKDIPGFKSSLGEKVRDAFNTSEVQTLKQKVSEDDNGSIFRSYDFLPKEIKKVMDILTGFDASVIDKLLTTSVSCRKAFPLEQNVTKRKNNWIIISLLVGIWSLLVWTFFLLRWMISGKERFSCRRKSSKKALLMLLQKYI